MTSYLLEALAAATETRRLEIGTGLLAEAGAVYRQQFGSRPAQIVADRNTFAAAGRALLGSLRQAGIECPEPFVFAEKDLHAEFSQVARLEALLAGTEVVPIAVGSGTINDLVKLAAHRTGRPYLAAATAASVDGYTSFGASIDFQGSKQTFQCPAPAVVLADLDVLCAAPPDLNAAGYADLLAKVTAGADWILADAVGSEPIQPRAWDMVQAPLRGWLSDPAGVRTGSRTAIRSLLEGLLVCGFAMQFSRTSRTASGAEHLFSHLWDMEHHTHHGRTPLHGFKVGIGTLAVTRLYEALFRLTSGPVRAFPDVETGLAAYPSVEQLEARIEGLFPPGALRDRARNESLAKHLDAATFQSRLEILQRRWPELSRRFEEQLIPSEELESMLRRAGAPIEPEVIGISRERLRDSYIKAAHIRSRYNVLDFAVETLTLESALRQIFQRDDHHGNGLDAGD